jgi:methyl-accepting chemotaxis protein
VGDQLADRLGRIAAAVDGISEVMVGIASDARAQAGSAEQARTAVAEVDRVVQQNAASADQSPPVATQLSSQAAALATLVGSFQLATGSRG